MLGKKDRTKKENYRTKKSCLKFARYVYTRNSFCNSATYYPNTSVVLEMVLIPSIA